MDDRSSSNVDASIRASINYVFNIMAACMERRIQFCDLFN